MDKNSLDPSLKSFLVSLISIILKACLFISVASMLGVQTTSFVALLGAVGLAVGMALRGTLSNFAGGVMILLFRPFKVGDVVEAQGVTGTVKSIQIFNTIMLTPDKKTIILPNGPLSTGNMTNYSIEPVRRVDLSFGIGYDDDLKLAKDTLEAMAKSDERVLSDPPTDILVSELGDNAVTILFRPYVKKEDYWGVHFDMIERVKLKFDELGISFPYPQQDVYMHQK
jgi:small conductance mechanosensitive channel